MTQLPYGTWPSPITYESLAAGRVSISGLQFMGGGLWWVESRPNEGGRQALVCLPLNSGDEAAKRPIDVLPTDVSVRSRVHEYGGGSSFVSGWGIVYTSQSDQGLWLIDQTQINSLDYRNLQDAFPLTPIRLTPETPPGEEHRYADARPIGGRSQWVAVRERHYPGGQDDEIVLVDASAPGSDPKVLISGRDFYAAPRLSRDARRIAWIEWDLPNMPWDGCELWVADLESDWPSASIGVPEVPLGTVSGIAKPLRVSGGKSESVGQPMWMWREDQLLFVTDLHDYWQPHVWDAGDPSGAPRRITNFKADFHSPDWALGQTTIAPADNDIEKKWIICRYNTDAGDALCVLNLYGEPDQPVKAINQPCVTVRGIATGAGLFTYGATPTESSVIVVSGMSVALTPGEVEWDSYIVSRRASRPDGLTEAAISSAEGIEFPISGGGVITKGRAFYYPPLGLDGDGKRIEAPPGDLPPVIIQVHGGPTGSNEIGFDPVVQFWTSRGFGLCEVDYRGSAGYGRDFRTALNGLWGVVDPQDCLSALQELINKGLVDPQRALIRGGSSGGLTALLALAAGSSFSGALVNAGVTDLCALARDTHKFESGYLETIVGPFASERSRYEERSPMNRVEEMTGAVLLLQGADDAIVPPSQAAEMAKKLRTRGMRCEHVVFQGEGHGLRRAENLISAARMELEFAREILGVNS